MSTDYNFSEIEKKWQEFWAQHRTFQVTEDESRPKFYVLDMFPYPSGAGLHVGHPLGYIASSTCWTCFPIRPERGCMSGIRWVI